MNDDHNTCSIEIESNFLCIFVVCVEELNKCYIIVDLKNEEKDPGKSDISWDLFNAEFCGQQRWSMINVHSRSEQEFIREWTKRVINIKHAVANPGGYNGYAYLGNVFVDYHFKRHLFSKI